MTALAVYLIICLLLAFFTSWALFADEQDRRDFDRETGLEMLPYADSLRTGLMLLVAPVLPLLLVLTLIETILDEVSRGEE